MNNLLQQNGASNVRRSARSAFGRRPGGRDWTHVRIATYSFLIVAWFASHAPNQADAGVMLGDVRANGNIDATAVFANISGNDNGSPKGTALLDLLNDGGTGSFINNSNWKNTSGGMFSTAANGSSGDIYDLTDGTALGNLEWTSIGKIYEAVPFKSNVEDRVGTLELESPLFANSYGNIVLSLKAGQGYSVFAFQNVTNVSSFSFDTQSIVKANGQTSALSHATLYTAPSSFQLTQGQVPEPASIAIFGALGLMGIASRRRQAARVKEKH